MRNFIAHNVPNARVMGQTKLSSLLGLKPCNGGPSMEGPVMVRAQTFLNDGEAPNTKKAFRVELQHGTAMIRSEHVQNSKFLKVWSCEDYNHIHCLVPSCIARKPTMNHGTQQSKRPASNMSSETKTRRSFAGFGRGISRGVPLCGHLLAGEAPVSGEDALQKHLGMCRHPQRPKQVSLWKPGKQPERVPPPTKKIRNQN